MLWIENAEANARVVPRASPRRGAHGGADEPPLVRRKWGWVRLGLAAYVTLLLAAFVPLLRVMSSIAAPLWASPPEPWLVTLELK